MTICGVAGASMETGFREQRVELRHAVPRSAPARARRRRNDRIRAQARRICRRRDKARARSWRPPTDKASSHSRPSAGCRRGRSGFAMSTRRARSVEKLRKLGERDRSLVIEAADRMTFAQQPRGWRNVRRRAPRAREIDRLSGPAAPHRRRCRREVRIGIGSAERIGVPARRAPRVEQEIVEVPENEFGIPFGGRRSLS